MTKYTAKFLHSDEYNPGALLDHLSDVCKVPNDSQLARRIGVSAPIICKIRKKQHAITGDLLVRMWDLTGVDVDKLREIAGIQKSAIAPQPRRVEVIEREAENV